MSAARTWSLVLAALALTATGCGRSKPASPPTVPTTLAAAGGADAIQARTERPEAAHATADAAAPVGPIGDAGPGVSADVGAPAGPALDAGTQPEPQPDAEPEPAPTGELTVAQLLAFTDRAAPVATWVDQAIGAAAAPDGDPVALRAALDQLATEQARLDGLRQAMRARHRALLVAGPKDRLPRRKGLTKGFTSHTMAAAGVDAAALKLKAEAGFVAPLEGGPDLGPQLASLGLLLGTAAGDAVLARQPEEALRLARLQARFGALIASSGRTLAEVSAGVGAAQDALALMEWMARRALVPEGVVDVDGLRTIRRSLGVFGTDLGRMGRALRDPAHVGWLAPIARRTRSRVWLHEALTALAHTIRARSGTPDAVAARAALLGLAEEPERPELSEAAARTLLPFGGGGGAKRPE